METLSRPAPLIIAHRGASGYLPEHTLPAKALAYAMGADYLEQDVVLTRDDVPIVLHDIHLDTTTDVASRYAGRQRPDGRYYALDFSWDEIRQLQVSERIDPRSGQAVFPRRFPVGKSSFRIPSLVEEIEFVQGLNHSTAGRVGIYPEIKAPAWHRQHGHDISHVVWQVLRQYDYDDAKALIYVQCFDVEETRRWREAFHSRVRLIQLIADDVPEHDRLCTPDGLRGVAEYADGIGPSLRRMVTVQADGPLITQLCQQAHHVGLLVHPYTVRADALPGWAASHDELLRRLVTQGGADGFFTDFPDLAVAWRKSAP